MTQEILTYIVVALAVGYVFRNVFQIFFVKKNDKSSCNCSSSCSTKKKSASSVK